MAGSSDAGPQEVGPSDEKQKKPRRARVHALASVGAVILAIAAIAVTTWALSRAGDGGDAGPDAHEATSESGTPSTDLEWNTATPTPTAPAFSMPTFPRPTPTDDGVPTSPLSFPSFPTPSVAYPTTTPTIRYPYNTPTTTTPSIATPTTTSPTTTAPTTQAPIKVRPIEPRATPITRCGTFGSLRVVTTTGVRYERTVGNGREGRWVVRAYARKGYVIASGARTRFEGNLGKFRPCPGDPTIDEVTKVSTGNPDPGAWDLTVATTVPGTRDRELALTFFFTTEVRVIGNAGEGWNCQDVEDPVAAGTPIACTYTGDAPPDVTLSVVALDGDQTVEPQGTLALTTDGKVTDDAEF